MILTVIKRVIYQHMISFLHKLYFLNIYIYIERDKEIEKCNMYKYPPYRRFVFFLAVSLHYGEFSEHPSEGVIIKMFSKITFN